MGPGESFAETDKRYLAAEAGANRDDGCTAVTAVLTEHSVVVAHVGDSRAVLSRAGKGAPPVPWPHLNDCEPFVEPAAGSKVARTSMTRSRRC